MKKERNIPLILLIGLISFGFLGTIAYLSSISLAKNTWKVAKVSNEVKETFHNKIKENVSIKNTGDIPTYVRAKIVISYEDNDGIILDDEPVLNTDYSLTLSNSTNWIYNANDGFYYYKNIVNPNTETDILIRECKELTTNTDKVLTVDIISQNIQANPTSAVEEAWNVVVSNNILTLGS